MTASMSLDVKVSFGNLSLVSALAFSSRTKVIRMAGSSPGYPVNLLKMATSIRLRKLSSIKYKPSKID